MQLVVSEPAPTPSPSLSTNANAKPAEQVPFATQLPSPPSCSPNGQLQPGHTHAPARHDVFCAFKLQSASAAHSAQRSMPSLHTGAGPVHTGAGPALHAPDAASHVSAPSQNAPSSHDAPAQSQRCAPSLHDGVDGDDAHGSPARCAHAPPL